MLPDRVSNPGPLTYESGAKSAHCLFSKNNVINLQKFCLLDKVDLWNGSTLKGKNLLLEEQILSFKS